MIALHNRVVALDSCTSAMLLDASGGNGTYWMRSWLTGKVPAVRLTALLAAAVLATAGCTSSSHTSAPPTVSSPAASSTTTTGVPSLGSSHCHASELAATDEGASQGDVTTNTVDGTIVFRNIGARTCTLSGYPGLQRYDANHQPAPTTVQRDPSVPPTEVTLNPQEQATVRYTVHTPSEHVKVDTSCYPVAPVMQITLPDESDSLEVTAQMPPCDPVLIGAIRHGNLTWSAAA